MQVLVHYPAGTVMFSAPGSNGSRVVLPPCPFPVKVYHDPPGSSMHLGALPTQQSGISMLYEGMISGESATILLDSGASASFISKDLADELQLHVQPFSGAVRTADGHDAQVTGKCTVRVKLQHYRGDVTFFVCPLSTQFDAILGDDWLTKHNAQLDFAAKRCVLRKSNGRRVVISSNITTPAAAANGLHILSALQFKRAVRKGAEAFLVVVEDVGDRPPQGAQSHSCPSASSPPGCLNALKVSDIGTTAVNQKDLDRLLNKYRARFPDELPKFKPRGNMVKHTIPLEPGAKPPCRPIYRLSQPELEELRKQITELLLKGYIEPSSSPYGAPVLFVKKKDGTLRMCIDYRALNQLTVKNKYPLPRIDDLLDSLSGSKCFSSLDLKSGYHQIQIDPEDIPKTAFRTPFGHFQYKVLCFGLTNAPSVFQAAMNDIFRDYLNDFVLVYLDDILIYSKTPEEHLLHLEKVLKRLEEYNLYANLKKCEFGKTHLDFLGHVVGADGIRVDPKKTAVVNNWPQPKTVTQLRSFLGLSNYFRRFIQNYSTMVAPLTSLTKKNKSVALDWDDSCTAAFAAVKKALVSAPVMVAPDFTGNAGTFEVIADASLVGIGAALTQDGRAVAYFSRKLTTAEQKYTTTEQECLAVLCALREWRCYLEGVKFIVHTDHQPLTFANTSAGMSRRQTRWVEELQRYTFTWKYKKGSENMADSLSRVPGLFDNAVTLLCAVTRDRKRTGAGSATTSKQAGSRTKRPKESLVQSRDAAMQAVHEARAKASSDTSTAEPSSQHVDAPAGSGASVDQVSDLHNLIREGYKVDPKYTRPEKLPLVFMSKKGLWWRRDKLAIPAAFDLRTTLMREAHDANYSGHLGFKKTLDLLQRHYWWPGMRKDIQNYVQTCESCQRNKSSNHAPAGPLQPLPVPDRRWASVSMDLITDLPVTPRGYDSVLVIMDRLSKMAHFVPCKKTLSSQELAVIFAREVIRLHGFPKSIISDRDVRFTSLFWRDLCKIFGTKLGMSTAFHPQTDGQTERMNRFLEEMLRHYVSPTMNDWDVQLVPLEFAVNKSKQDSTNMSPFEIVYGEQLLDPLNMDVEWKAVAAQEMAARMRTNLQRARTAIAVAQAKQKKYADSKRLPKPITFTPGRDMVMLNTKHLNLKAEGPRKLNAKFCGPFEVLAKIGAVAYKLKLPPAWKRLHDVFHVSLLKKYHSNTRAGERVVPPLDLNLDLDDKVEFVLRHRPLKIKVGRTTKLTREYLVKWLNKGSEHNTYEPEDKVIANNPEALVQYWKDKGDRS